MTARLRGTIGLAFLLAAPLLHCTAGADGHALPSVPGGDAGVCTPSEYPQAGTLGVGAALPELTFDGIDEHGAPGPVRLRDYFEPCAATSRLLVLRVHGGAWCGTCRWHAAHTGELKGLGAGPRLRIVDLVVGDRDNGPARAADLAEWRGLVDSPDGVAMAADPSFALRGLVPNPGTTLPLYVLVDTRTMRVMAQAPNPDPVELAREIDETLAKLDGRPAPAPPQETLVDGLFHRNEWDMIQAVAAPEALPADPTNAVADDASAAALGKQLFFDASLSPSGTVSCATCHDPKKQLSDGLAQAQGVARGDRKTPRIALAAFSRWQFWDGRADTLWAQALGPFENPTEFASSRLFVAHRIRDAYAAQYQAAFPSHALPDMGAWPANGMPGDSAYDALSAGDRAAITRVFVDAGKAIAAYERTFRTAPSSLDAYAKGDPNALSNGQKLGLSVFVGVGCMQCHWGPRLTDDAFHVTRTATGRADGKPDRGRADGVVRLLASEFGASSAWSDAPSSSHVPQGLAPTPEAVGAFKTPSLRGVAAGAPFGHGGMLPTLVGVTELYGSGGLGPNDPRAVGSVEPWLPRFDVTAQWSIGSFLPVLTGDPIAP